MLKTTLSPGKKDLLLIFKGLSSLFEEPFFARHTIGRFIPLSQTGTSLVIVTQK